MWTDIYTQIYKDIQILITILCDLRGKTNMTRIKVDL